MSSVPAIRAANKDTATKLDIYSKLVVTLVMSFNDQKL